MKKILIAIGVLVVVVIGALVVLPALVPADRIRDEVVAEVKAATGRDLTIEGKVAVSAFPSLSVQVANVALSNPPGFSSKDLVRLGALDIRLKLLPILSGRIEIDSFVLVDPVITLEVDRHGKANWVFANGGIESAKPESRPAAEQAANGGGAGLDNVVLGEVRIQNGRLSYIDGPAGTREEIDAVTLAVGLKSLDDPLSAKGSAKWRGKAIELAVAVAKPRALVDGNASAADISLSSDAVTLAFKGEANGGKAAGVTGDLDLEVPSVRGLVQWATAKPLDMAGSGLGPFALKGKLTAGGTKVALSQAAIAIDAITATGDFVVDTGGSRPALRGKLDVDSLDLNPYLPPEQPAKPGSGTAKAGPGGWSDDVIDASGLKAADVDFALTVGAIKVRKIQIGKSALHLRLAGGRMTAELTELALYKGTGKGRLAIDGNQPGIGIDANFALKGLAAEPFLSDAADFDRLSGTGNFDVQITSRGRSQRALVSALDGKGAVSFTDGAIKGINLAEMVRNIGSAFTDSSGSQATDFAELGGTFTVTDGIVTNKDLALKSPLLRVEGAGTVELPPRTMHYRIEPKAVASLEGQGGRAEAGGVTVPVIVEGPWDNPSYRPDLAAMVQGQATRAIQDAIGAKLPGGLPAGLLGGNPGALFGR